MTKIKNHDQECWTQRIEKVSPASHHDDCQELLEEELVAEILRAERMMTMMMMKRV